MGFPAMWYVRPAKPQISLRIRAVWSEPLLVAWIFYDCYANDWTLFGVSTLKRTGHMSKCHIVGNHMRRLITILCDTPESFEIVSCDPTKTFMWPFFLILIKFADPVFSPIGEESEDLDPTVKVSNHLTSRGNPLHFLKARQSVPVFLKKPKSTCDIPERWVQAPSPSPLHGCFTLMRADPIEQIIYRHVFSLSSANHNCNRGQILLCISSISRKDKAWYVM